MAILLIIFCVSGQHAALRDRHFGEVNFSVKLDVNFGLNEWRKEQFENANLVEEGRNVRQAYNKK